MLQRGCVRTLGGGGGGGGGGGEECARLIPHKAFFRSKTSSTERDDNGGKVKTFVGGKATLIGETKREGRDVAAQGGERERFIYLFKVL